MGDAILCDGTSLPDCHRAMPMVTPILLSGTRRNSSLCPAGTGDRTEEGKRRMGLLTATREVDAIKDIDIRSLVDAGIRCVLVDRDNTCVPRGQEDAPADVIEWFGRLQGAGIVACIVSNNFRNSHIAKTAEQLGCGFVCLAWKPTPFALHRVLRILRFKPSETVMIGDQSYTDIMAGNLMGMTTILVKPQDPDAEPRYTRLMRRMFEGGRRLGRKPRPDADEGEE